MTDLEKLQKLVKVISKEARTKENLQEHLKKLTDEKNSVIKLLKLKRDQLEKKLEFLEFRQEVDKVCQENIFLMFYRTLSNFIRINLVH